MQSDYVRIEYGQVQEQPSNDTNDFQHGRQRM